MKMDSYFRGYFWCSTIVIVVVCLKMVSIGSELQKKITIPEDIYTIFQTSCMQCHGFKGGRFPKARLNFARWTEYSVSKEVEKSLLICSALRKGIMPPKSVRKARPEIIPTKEQIEMICKWAQSLKTERGKKQVSGQRPGWLE